MGIDTQIDHLERRAVLTAIPYQHRRNKLAVSRYALWQVKRATGE
jgi:hypothetical protein